MDTRTVQQNVKRMENFSFGLKLVGIGRAKKTPRASSDRRPFDKNTYFTWYTIFANVLPTVPSAATIILSTFNQPHGTPCSSPFSARFSFEVPNQNQAAVFGDSGVWTSHGKYSGMSLLYCEKSVALYFSVSNSVAGICTYKYSASSSAENTTKITRSNCKRHTRPVSSGGVPASEWGVVIAAQNENKTCLFRLLRLQEFPNFPKRDLSRTFDGVAVDPRRNGGESLDTDEQ
jgi:hypothetical protein